MEIENELSRKIIGCAIEVHKSLGSGLLENAYEECLYYKIKKEGMFVEKQKPLPLIFEEVKMDIGYRVDLIVENKLIVELKSVEAFTDVHLAQVLTYLKLSNIKLGLLINFNVKRLTEGVANYFITTLCDFFVSFVVKQKVWQQD
ncbi:MAG TPA: GxxExxY protein [Chitinophagaceae bacterium]|nr:GxxExxY protein [Chitinophagaceae bacterium]